MPASDIVIKGAREHNLRDIDLVLPRNRLICFTGVSGSGKSSLAFDTLYAEGQRRYVESLSSYARQFLGQLPKPDVDLIGGISPSISISQKSAGSNPRSTVGTMTEIYDFLRVLYARVGTAHCPECQRPITAQTRDQIIASILSLPPGTSFLVLAPVVRGQKGEHRDLLADYRKQGFARARVDGRTIELSDDPQLDRRQRHHIEIIVDRLLLKGNVRARLAEAVDLAMRIGQGTILISPASRHALPAGADGEGTAETPTAAPARDDDLVFSLNYACTHCGVGFAPPNPQMFSFNSPHGMCLECDGLGTSFTFDLGLLIPDTRRSMRDGCIELIGPWKSLSRWRRHVYQGVADTIERLRQLPEGSLLDLPWRDLPADLQRVWLHGTGDQHITFTWRGGASPIKYGGKFAGIIPDLMDRYRSAKSKALLARLEPYMRVLTCPGCQGARIHRQARNVYLVGKNVVENDRVSLPDLCRLSIADTRQFLSQLQLDPTREIIARDLLKEIHGRLEFLLNVGLDYLSLERTAPTLSGGESQRIRLASQIGCGLVGVLYILDEPSIGLHPRDNDRLLATLEQLRDIGNTVIVVEHDEETIRRSDHVVDFGPGAGVRGGHVVSTGPVDSIIQCEHSITGQFLSGQRCIPTPQHRRSPLGPVLRVVNACHNNLRNVDVEIPLGLFVCVTGVSGSGKSSLVNDILIEALRRDLNHGEGSPGGMDRLEGLEHLDKMIAIDQSPIGRTPRSNPGTYIKVFDEIRKLFAKMPESRRRGYQAGRFSFNVDGGRCSACDGNGANRLEMDFLADIWVTCPVCEGHRFNRETLGIRFRDRSIADVLEMDVQEALDLFANVPAIAHKLQTLHDVGLDYVKLGQPSPTLSGGEAQRIKLARELVKKSTGKTIYLLDEPTTGLHFADIHLLLNVLHSFVHAGNTVVVVEHNLDVIKTADWVVDLGPEGGAAGGLVVAQGTPEQLVQCAESHTGRAMRPILSPHPPVRKSANGKRRASGLRAATPPRLARTIDVHGASEHNLKHVALRIPRDQMTVFCGPSGSGKSSLAIDTIYAEGQRRYVESLSAYARQFVGQMQKPHVERIDGLSPAIALEQQNLGHTPRSTVGTTTEIYDYLRILYARLGTPFCPDCDEAIGTQSVDEIIDKVLAMPEGTLAYLLAPIAIEVGEELQGKWDELRAAGYRRVRVNGTTLSLDGMPSLDRRRRQSVQAVIDRIAVNRSTRPRLAESVEAGLAMGKGVLHVASVVEGRPEPEWPVQVHSQHLACGRCGRSFDRLTPHNFSFNSPLGWCPECDGLGSQVGTDPTALFAGSEQTLAEGAILLWPALARSVSQAMLSALAMRTGISLDVPLQQLSGRHRRLLLHGTGDKWFDVKAPQRGENGAANGRLIFRFQFKGLYPAIEEAARMSPALRQRLAHMTGEVECAACAGSRLRDDAAAVRFRELTIDEVCRLPLGQLTQEIQNWKLTPRERRIAGELMREIESRVRFLNDVGLEYLTLHRPAATLSGGESQRIRLASQLGSGLCGVLYVLDEPTIGLHPRDNKRLLAALHRLRDLGNTLVLVEHDREILGGSDHLVDFGPGAGRRGGEIVASGSPAELGRRRRSVTGPFLAGRRSIPVPGNRRAIVAPANRIRRQASGIQAPPPTDWLTIHGARQHNLKDIDVRIPLGRLVAVTGPSGSGKSSLIDDILYSALAARLHRASTTPGVHREISGIEQINKVIRVDQQPLGNSPASNPATYTGVFDLIRELFARLPAAKVRGYTPRRFSFNVSGGRCEACEGNGQKCIAMHFLPDVWLTCEECQGSRYNAETLSVQYHGHSIADVLRLSCQEALDLFQQIPKIRRVLQTLVDVGLDYLSLGQPAPTLSGGEAQRVKLAAELARPDTGRTIYLLDEPTTGLHFEDLAKLLDVLQRLVDLGNTVVVIEHNLDVIKCADWVIDLGPEAGAAGGYLVAEGSPETITEPLGRRSRPPACGYRSSTAEALLPVLQAGPIGHREPYRHEALTAPRAGDIDLERFGAQEKMPWEKDGPTWHIHGRVGRTGIPGKWSGRVLEEVVRRIEESGRFAPANWQARTIVEITGADRASGWFFHAITGETWLLKLKFRVARNTFARDQLVRDLDLKPLNQLDDLPVYGNEPRVKCRNLRGPWQEIEVRLHSWEETNTPAFWSFVQRAVEGFQQIQDRVSVNPEDLMPWKKLGRRWHFSRKGFPPGKRIEWQPEILEELCDLLHEKVPDGQFLWNNQQVVHLFLKEQAEPWASIYTKRLADVDLVLSSPKGRIALGRVELLGHSQEIDTAHAKRDLIKLKFRTSDDLARGDLAGLLDELRHSNTVNTP